MYLSAVPPPLASSPWWCGDQAIACTERNLWPSHNSKIIGIRQKVISGGKISCSVELLDLHVKVERDLNVWRHIFHQFTLKQGSWSHQKCQKSPQDNLWEVSAWIPRVHCSAHLDRGHVVAVCLHGRVLCSWPDKQFVVITPGGEVLVIRRPLEPTHLLSVTNLGDNNMSVHQHTIIIIMNPHPPKRNLMMNPDLS